MSLGKIIKFVKAHGWKQQNCGMTGVSGNSGTNFYKNGKVLTLSMVEEGTMTFPNEDELREMFGDQ